MPIVATCAAAMAPHGAPVRACWLYRLGARIAIAALNMLGKDKGRFARLPLASGWTDGRDLPAPQSPETFMTLYKKKGSA